MKPLAERLRDWSNILLVDSGPEKPEVRRLMHEDLKVAAQLLALKDDGPKLVPIGTPTVAEERLAWDRYAAAALSNREILESAVGVRAYPRGPRAFGDVADQLLEERRKRFGAGK